MEKALIFNIQRYSLQDGPGVRTTVFLKGCPLRCIWCSNPESWNSYPEVAHSNSLCTKCGECIKECPLQAISFNDKGVQISRDLCNNCGKCVETCYPGALKVFGRWLSINEALDEVVRDEPYYRNSGGGVTVSGGEPLMQADFVQSFLRNCKQRGLHTVLDTAGYASPDILREVLKYVDLVFYDVKCLNPTEHRKLTGVSNQLILDNARRIAAEGKPLILRVPIIPGVNDTEDAIRAIGSFAASLNDGVEVNLLPYHRLGMSKYDSLDREYELRSLPSLTAAECDAAREILQSFGLECKIVV